MNNLSKIIESRRSIRKFLPDEIPDETIYEIIEAGMNAPSGCNSQCWKFVAVRNIAKLGEIIKATEKGIYEFYKDADNPDLFIESRIKQITFFKNAPVVIFVFLTSMEYYDDKVVGHYEKKGYSYREMLDLMGYPDVLSIGAAIENMLLTIHDKGLGACWMNDPIVSKKEICEILDVTGDCQLISVIPVGKPAYTPRNKKIKDIHDVMKII